MAWKIKLTDVAEQWIRSLDAKRQGAITAALDALEDGGPGQRRPRTGHIKGSRHRNMKELRSVGGNVRALFAFDPKREGIVLIGGDKTHDWKGWYERNTARADALYDRHLRGEGKERPWPAVRAGLRFVEGSR